MENYIERIKNIQLQDVVVSPEEATSWIEDGMTLRDVDVIVTEQGYADLRGLAPRERVGLIIESCAYPMYRELLQRIA